MNIISCSSEHLEEVRAIYNHYILNDAALFYEEPFSAEAYQVKYADIVDNGYPFFVAVNDSGRVIGFAYAGEFRHASAYRLVESTIYLSPGQYGSGIGRKLYEALFVALEKNPKVFGIMAIITGINTNSIAFHEHLGFENAGIWRNAGHKFGQTLDVHCLQMLRPFVRGASVSGIDSLGFTLNVDGREYRLDFKNYPWFEYCTIHEIMTVRSDDWGVHWDEAGIKLEKESIKHPDAHPPKINVEKWLEEKRRKAGRK